MGLSAGCGKGGIGNERPPSSAVERLVGKADLSHEVGTQHKRGQHTLLTSSSGS